MTQTLSHLMTHFHSFIRISLTLLIRLGLISSFIIGCASKEKVFSDAKMDTMDDIYKKEFGSRLPIIQQNRAWEEKNPIKEMTLYTRDARNELYLQFPELPNTKLTMYVFPHITETNMPIPGYTTHFYLYRQTHFALPGEIQEKPE